MSDFLSDLGDMAKDAFTDAVGDGVEDVVRGKDVDWDKRADKAIDRIQNGLGKKLGGLIKKM